MNLNNNNNKRKKKRSDLQKLVEKEARESFEVLCQDAYTSVPSDFKARRVAIERAQVSSIIASESSAKSIRLMSEKKMINTVLHDNGQILSPNWKIPEPDSPILRADIFCTQQEATRVLLQMEKMSDIVFHAYEAGHCFSYYLGFLGDLLLGMEVPMLGEYISQME
eukprot:TRINITY_DN9194_c0_g1_i1.p1 TRINITY_DN9194_c0_g1~~TRINITY_DN9194_c0_g1_i1.p1  ORF type:complete len:166 (-),score=26.02 TRINITY_DN9194_c0_g1_i1:152-649(-)